MCCGTHVDNLSHLQIIKLLQVEKGKKGKSNLYFLAGNRVSKYVEEKWSMDKNITKSLKVFRTIQIFNIILCSLRIILFFKQMYN